MKECSIAFFLATMKEVHTFPILNNSEILQCMSDLEIPFSNDDLLKPTTARVLEVFELFVDQLMGQTEVQSFQVDMLDYPEISRGLFKLIPKDSISLLGFYRQLLKLFKEVGVDKFSLRDILKPEPQRVLFSNRIKVLGSNYAISCH